MSIISEKPTAPRITFTGKRVAGGTNITITNYDIVNDIVQTGTLRYHNHDPIIFRGPVTVTMTSVYPLKGYSHYTEGPLKFVGEFNDPKNIEKAEIHYTLQGFDTFKDGLFTYKKAFVLDHDDAIDTYNISAKLTYLGVESDITNVTFKIIN